VREKDGEHTFRKSFSMMMMMMMMMMNIVIATTVMNSVV
jgi:hypothetical protein